VFIKSEMLQHEASELRAVRDKAKIIHGTKDIDAAGDEVEIAVRKFLVNNLPSSCAVSHGHLVDIFKKVSPQLDVLIWNNNLSANLFKSNNGTSYIPAESAYVIGEIKTKYDKHKKPIQEFAEKCKYVIRDLHRVAVFDERKVVRNPYFKFMFFFEANGFDIADLEKFIVETPEAHLPNVICFLDAGLMANGKIRFITPDRSQWTVDAWNLHPEYKVKTPGSSNGWFFGPFGKEEIRSGATLGYLLALITEHVQFTILNRVPLMDYVFDPDNLRDGKAVIRLEDLNDN
jgi:hypothetical protein